MNVFATIPILRIFDEKKAFEFYVDWLGFQVDWQHRFDENAPLYLQISLGNLVLHLSEHQGDACPGANVFVECEGLEAYHALLSEKNYKYNHPGLENAPWDALTMTVSDPFGNRITFNQRKG